MWRQPPFYDASHSVIHEKWCSYSQKFGHTVISLCYCWIGTPIAVLPCSKPHPPCTILSVLQEHEPSMQTCYSINHASIIKWPVHSIRVSYIWDLSDTNVSTSCQEVIRLRWHWKHRSVLFIDRTISQICSVHGDFRHGDDTDAVTCRHVNKTWTTVECVFEAGFTSQSGMLSGRFSLHFHPEPWFWSP